MNLQPPSSLNSGPLDWVLGTLTTRPLPHVKFKLCGLGKIQKKSTGNVF